MAQFSQAPVMPGKHIHSSLYMQSLFACLIQDTCQTHIMENFTVIRQKGWCRGPRC